MRLFQPQRHVLGLHGLADHRYEVATQGFQVYLVAQSRGENFQGLPRVVLASVEAPVDEGLDARP